MKNETRDQVDTTHFCQRCLADLWNRGLAWIKTFQTSQSQECSRQPLFAPIASLIKQIFLITEVARDCKGANHICQFCLFAEREHHNFVFNS